MNRKTKLTSVNVDIRTHKEFKKIAIESELSFQKFVNISLHSYVNDRGFRSLIENKIED